MILMRSSVRKKTRIPIKLIVAITKCSARLNFIFLKTIHPLQARIGIRSNNVAFEYFVKKSMVLESSAFRSILAVSTYR